MSVFVLDASYTLTWCFPDRATPNTDATLRRLESRADSAIVPWIWQVEIGNALGKAVSKGKVALPRALEIWGEFVSLPIRQVALANIPPLLQLAVQHNFIPVRYVLLATGYPIETSYRNQRPQVDSSGRSQWRFDACALNPKPSRPGASYR